MQEDLEFASDGSTDSRKEQANPEPLSNEEVVRELTASDIPQNILEINENTGLTGLQENLFLKQLFNHFFLRNESNPWMVGLA